MANLHPFLTKLNTFNPNQTALIYEDDKISYGELLNEVQKQEKLLASAPKGSCVAIVGDYDLSSISFLLANLNRQNLVAPLIETSEIGAKMQEGQIEFCFQNGKLKQVADLSAEKHQLITQLKEKNANGLLLFSSGSTGKPKAIVHNLDILLNSYLDKTPKQMNFLLFLMFDHIGGLNTLFNTLCLGACGIGIKDRKNIDMIAKAVQDYKISILPASPSLLNLMLLKDVKNKFDLSSLRLITYGTEKMPDSLLAKLKEAFKKVRFHQTFGTSEVGITQTSSSQNAIKLENIQYKIVNGELFLKSNTQALGYLNANNDAFDDDGFFATGDLVEKVDINGEEYLRILGRSKELINIGGEKLLPQEVEGVLLQMPEVKDCLVFAEKNAITGQSVSVKIVLAEDVALTALQLKKEIRLFCKGKLADYKIPTKIFIVDSLAVTERFKKQRG